MDSLTDLNKKNKFFKQKEFTKYIAERQVLFVREYFLNRYQYTPCAIYDFFTSGYDAYSKLGVRDKMVLFVKSLLFWRNKSKVFT
jgi:hypothetical protein